jgi:hypothetical protein
MPAALIILLCVAVAALGVALLFLLPFFLMVFIFSLGLFLFVFWIWMLVEAIKNQALSEGEKIGWVLAIVFLHVLGSVLYVFLGRSKRLPPGRAPEAGPI